jgi:hypothetical protein
VSPRATSPRGSATSTSSRPSTRGRGCCAAARTRNATGCCEADLDRAGPAVRAGRRPLARHSWSEDSFAVIDGDREQVLDLARRYQQNAVFEWTPRLFLIELKTERRSHRPGQLAHYLDLATHHHPDRAVDLLYLTPTMDAVAPEPLPLGATYAHAAWPAVGDLIASTWASSGVTWERTVAGRLTWWIEQLELGAPLPGRDTQPSLPSEPAVPSSAEVSTEPPAAVSELDAALQLAVLVQRDGQQRAVDADVEDPEELDELRLEVRDHCTSGLKVDGEELTHVRPWIWSAATSGGRPLTTGGERTGYELRLSRYRAAQYG